MWGESDERQWYCGVWRALGVIETHTGGVWTCKRTVHIHQPKRTPPSGVRSWEGRLLDWWKIYGADLKWCWHSRHQLWPLSHYCLAFWLKQLSWLFQWRLLKRQGPSRVFQTVQPVDYLRSEHLADSRDCAHCSLEDRWCNKRYHECSS